MDALITGGAGFIGSHLTEALLAKGYQVTVLDDLSTGRLENLAHLDGNPSLRVVVGTVLDERLVDKLAEQADLIFHLAAAVGVQLIIDQPFQSLATNIRGTEIVLEMAYRYQCKTMVMSTSEIYGKNGSGPLGEEEDRILGSPLKYRWSYSIAKSVDEILANLYWQKRRLPTVIVRLFNTVGPRQTGHYGMVIPRLVTQALRGEPITVYGTGKQSRCFLHVADCVRTLIDLMEHPQAVGQVFNIGSQEEVTIEELARRISQLTGSVSPIAYVPYDQAYGEGFEDMQRRVPNTAKVARLCGFTVTRSLHDILCDVIADCKQRIEQPAGTAGAAPQPENKAPHAV